MNHKRQRPKHQRAGCLWCKPHKDERATKRPRAKREVGSLAEHVPQSQEAVEDLYGYEWAWGQWE